jgi:hypothetical protein
MLHLEWRQGKATGRMGQRTCSGHCSQDRHCLLAFRRARKKEDVNTILRPTLKACGLDE